MLDSLFNPKSVAIIGASTKELSIGNRIIKNLQDFGFKGSIYPINPKPDEVRGIKSYNSILDVSDEIDLVHIVIPNKFVPMAIEDCGKKGVKVVATDGPVAPPMIDNTTGWVYSKVTGEIRTNTPGYLSY